MTGHMMFLDCPAYLDEEGAVRCGLPAEVKSRSIMRSTDGPIENAMIRCPSGHWFNAPTEFLTLNEDTHSAGSAGRCPGTGCFHGEADDPGQSQIISQLVLQEHFYRHKPT